MFPAPRREHLARPGVPPDDWPSSSGNFPSRWRRLLASAGRACCCPARPAVVVLIPPTPGRPHQTELLLCRHHYLRSRQALTAARAVIHDPDDLPASQDAGHRTLAAASLVPTLW